jgi:methylenetetrahydrofolate dehydrogenase (NADP+)/methenyltetrahydrofolate cyclohydrolase
MNLFQHTKRADILIVAVGQVNFIDKKKIKQGVIIIDVGTNRVDGRLCGDVNFNDVLNKCGAITPSPGGVGPLTVSFLLKNTIKAYKKILNLQI